MNGKQALLLVGHGSQLGRDAGAPIRAHAARIRRLQVFDEVRVAFVKEAPLLRDGLAAVSSRDAFVVPVFLAEGYYTRGVVPRELGLTGETCRVGRHTVHYCPPVGAHPRMAELILERARRIVDPGRIGLHDAALVVIGHGTERHAGSGGSVHRLAARLRERSGFGRVACGFLDQAPGISAVVEGLEESHIVLVPFFVAEGMHTRETIPDALGLAGPRTERDGRTLWYSPPVGTHPAVARCVLDLARRRGARIPPPGRRGRARGAGLRRTG